MSMKEISITNSLMDMELNIGFHKHRISFYFYIGMMALFIIKDFGVKDIKMAKENNLSIISCYLPFGDSLF